MNKQRLFLAIVLIVASALFLGNLGNRYLWQDEAETALVAKTILNHGLPFGYDGKNFFSQEGLTSYGKDYLWVLDPWLPHYLVAASFRIFGVGTFEARFPFAVFGIATTILTYFFTLFFTKDKKVAAMATILLLISVPFLLLCRQSRYYAPVAFFSLLSLYGYGMLLERKKGGSATYAVPAILVFYCNHLFFATLLTTVVFHALICHRQRFGRVLLLSLIVSLANLPWLFWISGMRYVNLYGYRLFDKEFFFFFKKNLLHIHYYIFPLFLLLVPMFKCFFVCIKKKALKCALSKDAILWSNLLLLNLFIILTITGLSIASPAPFFRYLTQLIPIFCIIAAIILRSIVGKYFKTGVVIMAVLFGFAIYCDYQYRRKEPHREGIKYLNFLDYLEEIMSDYDCPNEGIAKYLNANGSDHDIVAITYGDLPLKFYTKMRVIGGLTGEDLSLVKKAKWIIIRKNILCSVDGEVAEYITQNVSGRYDKIVIDYPEMPWGNRPSPQYHKFRTIKPGDRVTIYRKN